MRTIHVVEAHSARHAEALALDGMILGGHELVDVVDAVATEHAQAEI